MGFPESWRQLLGCDLLETLTLIFLPLALASEFEKQSYPELEAPVASILLFPLQLQLAFHEQVLVSQQEVLQLSQFQLVGAERREPLPQVLFRREGPPLVEVPLVLGFPQLVLRQLALELLPAAFANIYRHQIRGRRQV